MAQVTSNGAIEWIVKPGFGYNTATMEKTYCNSSTTQMLQNETQWQNTTSNNFAAMQTKEMDLIVTRT